MQTIKIGKNNFFLNNLSSILNLRNEFRIYGNLFIVDISNILKKYI
jgi:hypothetical protein